MVDVISSILKQSETTRACVICAHVSKYRCTGCNLAEYCGVEHQRADWPNHRVACKILANTDNVSHIGDDVAKQSTQPPGFSAIVARIKGIMQTLIDFGNRVTKSNIYSISAGTVAQIAQFLTRIVSSSFDDSRETIASMFCLIPKFVDTLRQTFSASTDVNVNTAADGDYGTPNRCRELISTWGDLLLRIVYTLSNVISGTVLKLYTMISRAAKRAAQAMGAMLDFFYDRYQKASLPGALDSMYIAVARVVLYTSEAPTNIASAYSQAVEAFTAQEDEQRNTVIRHIRAFWTKYMRPDSPTELIYAQKIGVDAANLEMRNWRLRIATQIYNVVFGDHISVAISWILDPINAAYSVVSRWILGAFNSWSVKFVPNLLRRVFSDLKDGTVLDMRSLEPKALEIIQFAASKGIQRMAKEDARTSTILGELQSAIEALETVNQKASENLAQIQRNISISEYSIRISSITWSLSKVAARQIRKNAQNIPINEKTRMDGQELTRLRTGFNAKLIQARETAAARILVCGQKLISWLIKLAPDTEFGRMSVVLGKLFHTTTDNVYVAFERAKDKKIGAPTDNPFDEYFKSTSSLEWLVLMFTHLEPVWKYDDRPVEFYTLDTLKTLVRANNNTLLEALSSARSTFAQPWKLLKIGVSVLALFTLSFAAMVGYSTYADNLTKQNIDSFLINQIGIVSKKPAVAIQGLFARLLVDGGAKVVRARTEFRTAYRDVYSLDKDEDDLISHYEQSAQLIDERQQTKYANALTNFRRAVYDDRITAAMFESTLGNEITDNAKLGRWLLGPLPHDLEFIEQEMQDSATPKIDDNDRLTSASPKYMFRFDQYARLLESVGMKELIKTRRVNPTFGSDWKPNPVFAPQSWVTVPFEDVLKQAVSVVAPPKTSFDDVLEAEVKLFANGVQQKIRIPESLNADYIAQVHAGLDDQIANKPYDVFEKYLPTYGFSEIRVDDDSRLQLPPGLSQFDTSNFGMARVLSLPAPVKYTIADDTPKDTPKDLLGHGGLVVVAATESQDLVIRGKDGANLAKIPASKEVFNSVTSTFLSVRTKEITFTIYPPQLLTRFIDGAQICGKSIGISVASFSERVVTAIIDTLLWRSTIYERPALGLRDISGIENIKAPEPSLGFWASLSRRWDQLRDATQTFGSAVVTAVTSPINKATDIVAGYGFVLEYIRNAALFFSYFYIIYSTIKAIVSLVLYVQISYQVQLIKEAANTSGHTGPIPLPREFEPYVAPGYASRVVSNWLNTFIRSITGIVIARLSFSLSVPGLILYFGVPYISGPISRLAISFIPGGSMLTG